MKTIVELTEQERVAIRLLKVAFHQRYENVPMGYVEYSMGRLTLSAEGEAFIERHLPEPWRTLYYA